MRDWGKGWGEHELEGGGVGAGMGGWREGWQEPQKERSKQTGGKLFLGYRLARGEICQPDSSENTVLVDFITIETPNRILH